MIREGSQPNGLLLVLEVLIGEVGKREELVSGIAREAEGALVGFVAKAGQKPLSFRQISDPFGSVAAEPDDIPVPGRVNPSLHAERPPRPSMGGRTIGIFSGLQEHSRKLRTASKGSVFSETAGTGFAGASFRGGSAGA